MFWSQLRELVYAIDSKTTQLTLLGPLLVVILAWGVIGRVFHWRWPGARCVRGAAVVCGCCFVIYALHYPWLIGVFDHLEPTMLEIVRRTAAGEPAYHAIDAASRYSMLYGPNAYWVPAIATSLTGVSLDALKWLSAAFALAGFGFTVLALRRVASHRTAIAAGVIYYCGAALLFRSTLVWVRGDPQLLFWAAVGVWGATLRRPAVAFALIGLALGGCMNTKAHGALYVLPALALVLPRANGRAWLAFVLTAGLALTLPFWASHAISLPNYFLWLRVASKHGLLAATAMEILVLAAVLVLPLLLGLWRWQARCTEGECRQLVRRHGPSLICGLGALLAVVVFGAKHGGGVWHLMPLVPSGAVLLALMLRDEAESEATSAGQVSGWRIGFSTLAAFAVVGCLIPVMRLPGQIKGRAWSVQPMRDDVARLAAKYAEDTIGMGCADEPTYVQTFFRTELPGGQPFVVDTGALMDMQQGGVELPPATFEQLRRGAIKRWLVPKGQAPFTMRSWYEGQDLFGAEFRRVFAEHYRKTDTTGFFDVWTFQPR